MVRADQARQVLDNPAFQWCYEDERNRLIELIEQHQFDGTEQSRELALENMRQLQALGRIRGVLNDAIQAQNREVNKQRKLRA